MKVKDYGFDPASPTFYRHLLMFDDALYLLERERIIGWLEENEAKQ